MNPAALGLFAAGALAFVVSMFMPANQDWLGFLWAAFSLEIVLRGPQGAADYPLFLLVSVSNLLALVAPLAFAFARSGGRIVAHLLLLATIGSVAACFYYRPSPGIGYTCGGRLTADGRDLPRAAAPSASLMDRSRPRRTRRRAGIPLSSCTASPRADAASGSPATL